MLTKHKQYPIVVETYKNLELIQLGEEEWCVRLTHNYFFFKPSYEYFTLTLCGMTLLNYDLTHGHSISSYENASRVFIANKVMKGWKP